MMKVSFHTLGCKLNFAETSTIGKQFISRGFSIVSQDQPADVVVLNTCTVTERADRECRQIIRRALRRSPNAFIIVTGCYAQLRPEEISSIEGVDLVLGSQEKFDLFKYTNGLKKKSVPQVFVSCIDDDETFHSASSDDVGGRTRAFLKIQDGCDYSCAFCTIPLARGGSRSADESEIITEANRLSGEGFKELVLTGVNVGDYGKRTGSNLLELIRNLEQVSGIERIRISSIEPNLLTTEIVDFMLDSKKYCNHFHIPLQSGSEQILRKMRRRYTKEEYAEIVDYIRRRDPSAGIGADVITGFPGETEQLFEETRTFLTDLPLSYVHVFTYSERPDTDAINLSGNVEPRFRFERNEILRELSSQKRDDFYKQFIGNTLPVLFEGKLKGNLISGLTTNYIRIETEGDESMINKIENVSISRIDNGVCFAERISR